MNDDIVLTCDNKGHEFCLWQQQKTNREFDDLMDGNHFENKHTIKMIIKKFTTDDNGKYRCRFWRTGGIMNFSPIIEISKII